MVRRTVSPAGATPPPVDSLCASFVTELGVSGASISVVSYLGRQSTICSSDVTAAGAESAQFVLGEGPHWDALSTREPVLCADLASPSESRWPLFIDAARGLGLHAIFAFPMLMGAALVGVVDLYSTTARTVDRDFVDKASHMASRAAPASVRRALYSAEHHASEESPRAPALRREVHQATGMILSHLDTSATAAFSRLQGHAFVTGRPIEEIAREIVRGDLALSNLGDDSPGSEGD
jgi:transcriptional regulator with GAF, ATPase, and Fis domain